MICIILARLCWQSCDAAILRVKTSTRGKRWLDSLGNFRTVLSKRLHKKNVCEVSSYCPN